MSKKSLLKELENIHLLSNAIKSLEKKESKARLGHDFFIPIGLSLVCVNSMIFFLLFCILSFCFEWFSQLFEDPVTEVLVIENILITSLTLGSALALVVSICIFSHVKSHKKAYLKEAFSVFNNFSETKKLTVHNALSQMMELHSKKLLSLKDDDRKIEFLLKNLKEGNETFVKYQEIIMNISEGLSGNVNCRVLAEQRLENLQRKNNSLFKIQEI